MVLILPRICKEMHSRNLSLVWISILCCGPVLGSFSCLHTPSVPVVRAWHEFGDEAVTIEDDERALWEQAENSRRELSEGDLIVVDESLSGYLAAVLDALMPGQLPAGVPTPVVYVIRSARRNAVTTPDGAILISSSLLASLQNEAQLAALLGHELAHYLARHSLVEERYNALSSSTIDRMRTSRDQELYADRLSVEFIRRAGYDTAEALRMLTAIERDDLQAGGIDQRWRSHPFIPERIRALEKEINGAQDERARVGAESFDEAIAEFLLVAAEIELSVGLLDRANALIEKHLNLRPESGRGYYLLAEHARLSMPEGRRSAEARRAYERAVELAPGDPDALLSLALLYRENGNTARANALFADYLRVAPDAADRKIIERYISSGSDEAR